MSDLVFASYSSTVRILARLAKKSVHFVIFIGQRNKAYIFFRLIREIVKGVFAENTANYATDELKECLACFGYRRAITEGKTEEEAIEAGNDTCSAFFSSMSALQKTVAQNILFPTRQSTRDKCTAAMKNCRKTKAELLFILH